MNKSKHRAQDLAIFGAPPLFADKLHVGRPNVGRREALLQRVADILDRRWLTNNGPVVQEFEQRLAEYLGVRNCVAMCNATMGLEIAIRALNLSGEVIVPSFTFVATAHALQWQQITPVFCDVDPETHCLDPRRVAEMITPRTSGIIGVHIWGHPCAIEQLQTIAASRGLALVFDAAHAFGCSHRDRMIGNFGQAEVFSFHATKFFNTFEGGAVATNDDDLARRMRLMKNFGFAGLDSVVHVGTNGKMSEVSAAMGLTSFESLDEFLRVNEAHFATYQQELGGLSGIRLIEHDRINRNNFQYIVLEIEEAEAGITRDELVQTLHRENVVARRYFYPGCHRMEPYHSFFPHAGLLLAETERLTNRVMQLPTGTAVSTTDIVGVCSIVRSSLEGAEKVRARLREQAEARV